MSRGQFITIEGSEGVGKSTNITFIREYLESKGVDLLVTREPGGTPLAENIRELLLAKREEKELDRFESEKIEFFERVRAAYLQRVNVHPERFCVIDASGSLSDVQAAILKKLTQVLKKSDLSALSIN